MLQSLELENFKAFGERARIPLAPITLIFGENSAGKSTILQALYLLKQTLESRDTGVLLLPRTENGIVDLGSFQEMLFDHDLERTLSIRVDTKLDRELGIEFSFKRPSLEEEVLLDQIGIYDSKSVECIAKFQLLNTTEKPENFSSTLPLPSKSSAIECVWLTKESEYWKSEFEWCKENIEGILEWFAMEKWNLEQYLEYLIDAEDCNELKPSGEKFQKFHKKYQPKLGSLGVNIQFFASDFDLEAYISKRHQSEKKTVLGLHGLLPVGVISHETMTEILTSFHQQSDGTKTFGVAELVMVAGRALEQTLKDLFPMSPLRRPPERWYSFRGTTPQHVGYQGDLLPDLLLRRPELIDETNKWLKRLEIDYELEVKPIGTDSGDFFEMRLIDKRRKERVSVALPDVGFGISQLLPFIVQSLVSEGQIISIEQPEVHVHPKLQADLGELLAESIKRDNQFIVETRSEHLILRLQRLVYEGNIKPEDVSVIYVSRGPEGAKAERLRLDEEGDFIDEWPNGFFLERLRELR